MTQDERDLLLVLGEIFLNPPNEHRKRLESVVRTLTKQIVEKAKEIKPGDTVAVNVEVVRVGGGLVFFKSDDGVEAYRRVTDIVRKDG